MFFSLHILPFYPHSAFHLLLLANFSLFNTIKRHSSTTRPLLALKYTSSGCDSTHKRRWSCTQARCLGVARRHSGPRRREESTIHHQISFGPPIPFLPLALWCIFMFSNLVMSHSCISATNSYHS